MMGRMGDLVFGVKRELIQAAYTYELEVLMGFLFLVHFWLGLTMELIPLNGPSKANFLSVLDRDCPPK